MVKADGCVAIHADGGAYKPLNWMNAPNKLRDGDTWTVTNPAQESLTITVHEIISDSDHDLGVDPGLVRDGVEAHLQELLARIPPRSATNSAGSSRSTRPTSVRRPPVPGCRGHGRRRRGEAAWRDRWCRTTGALPRAPRT